VLVLNFITPRVFFFALSFCPKQENDNNAQKTILKNNALIKVKLAHKSMGHIESFHMLYLSGKIGLICAKVLKISSYKNK